MSATIMDNNPLTTSTNANTVAEAEAEPRIVGPGTAPTEPNVDELPTLDKLDIEHVAVHDDPRKWSNTRKNIVLLVIAYASMIAGLSANIQNPSIEDMERQLHATPSQISWSISLFILVQGNVPLLWSAISEIKGRKTVYLTSIAIFVVASIVVATSKSIGLVIGFRCLQGAGSSAVISIGAATLADIFETHERGTKMGIYYTAPLLGPSLGPIFGGVLTTVFNWRGSFWFLAIFAGISWLSFVFFKDTFRQERSLTYQNVWKSRMRERELEMSKRSSQVTVTENPVKTSDPSGSGTGSNEKKEADVAVTNTDVEAQAGIVKTVLPTIKLSLRDINPFGPLWLVLRRVNNVVILLASSLYFAFGFVVVYSTSRTLGSAYGYNALKIGLVLLSYGIGSICGSLLGGRWSDRVLSRLKAKNGGKGYPEMRLKSTAIGQILFPPSVLSYAWIIRQRVHISAICVFLFLCGFFSIWIYSSTLAYIVDANVGRSSTAVATNSSFRGIGAFVMTEVAVPLQDAIGDGWMYTLWAGLMLIAGLLVLSVLLKGESWRHAAELREERAAQKADQ